MSNSDQGEKRISSEQTELLRRIMMIVLAAVIVGAVWLCACSIRNERMRDKLYFPYAGNMFNEGVFPITMDEQAQKAEVKKVKRHGQTGKFKYYCSSVVRMQSYAAEGTISFGNVSTNDCALVFTLYDENDVPLCRSVGVTPGNYVHAIRLTDPREDGTYNCRLYVAAFDLETNAYLGAQYSDLILMIGG